MKQTPHISSAQHCQPLSSPAASAQGGVVARCPDPHTPASAPSSSSLVSENEFDTASCNPEWESQRDSTHHRRMSTLPATILEEIKVTQMISTTIHVV